MKRTRNKRSPSGSARVALQPSRGRIARAPRSRWGGTRVGAGRPARGPRASEPHKRRPSITPNRPIHVIAHLAAAIARIDRARARTALDRAIDLSLDRGDFRIVDLAFARSRLELVVEAEDRHALARGMQGFQVSAARALNRLARRRGSVFLDRYRATITK